MSKEVEDKINITRELTRKQIIDCSVLFLVFAVIFAYAKFFTYDAYWFAIILVALFIVSLSLFEFSKNYVKNPLYEIILQTTRETNDHIVSIQEQNKSQKENNNITTIKLNNLKELCSNVEIYGQELEGAIAEIKNKSQKSFDFLNGEYELIKANVEKMLLIRHKIQTIAELVLELSDYIQSISSSVGIVDDIAEQTNLLALNAAVEAARAGEHGKGFAVVASEIRKLADESKRSTSKITSLINNIQQSANSTVLATEEGSKEIEKGLEATNTTGENMTHLINEIKEILSYSVSVISLTEKLSTNSNTIKDTMDDFSQIVETNKKLAQQNEEIFERIEITSNNLKESVI